MVRHSAGPWGLPDWWAGLADELFDDVFICSPEAYPTVLATVSPLAPDGGPLATVHAALALARAPLVVVLPETLPAPALLEALAREPGEADVVLPAADQSPRSELLPGRFHRRCLKPLERALHGGEGSLPAGLRVKRL